MRHKSSSLPVSDPVGGAPAPRRYVRSWRAARSRISELLHRWGFRWGFWCMLTFTTILVVTWWIIFPVLYFAHPAQDILPPRSFYSLDFSYYYVAAFALHLNPYINVYDPHTLPSIAHAHHLYYDLTKGRFDYPLLLPILLIPLATLPFAMAARVWFVFNLMLWIVNSALITSWLHNGVRRAAPTERVSTSESANAAPPPHTQRWRTRGFNIWSWWTNLSHTSQFALIFGIFVCIGYSPFVEALELGQATMLLLTLLLLAPWLTRRGFPELAGVLLAVAALIKIFPIVIIAYYLFRKRYRVVFGAAIGFALLMVAMTMVVGLPGILSMQGIFSAVSTTQLTYVLNESLAYMPVWITVEAGGVPNIVSTMIGDGLIAIVALAFTFGVLLRSARDERAMNGQYVSHVASDPNRDDLVGYCWALCAMLLVTPISQEHYDIWLLPAILLSLGYALQGLGNSLRDGAGRVKFEAWLALGLMLALALTFDTLPFNYDGNLQLSLGPYVLGHPLRPIFMLLRPISALITWCATGILLLRPQAQFRSATIDEVVIPISLAGAIVAPDPNASASQREVRDDLGAQFPEPSILGEARWRYLAGSALAFMIVLIALRLMSQILAQVATPIPL